MKLRHEVDKVNISMDLFLNICDKNLNLSSSEESSDESSEESVTSKEIVEDNANVPEIDFLPVDRIDNALNKLQYSQTIVVVIDDLSSHDKHPVGQAELISQTIDAQISQKIEEYVKEGVYNIREMKRLLRLAVKDIFENENLPPPNNRRFYPCTSTIRSHIVKMRQKLRKIFFSDVSKQPL
nr:uncharacterized protein LOC124817297 [Hydra vulgaris]